MAETSRLWSRGRKRIMSAWFFSREMCTRLVRTMTISSLSGPGYTFQGETGDFWGGVVFSYAFAGILGMFTGAMLTVFGWLSIADRVYVSTGVGFVSILLCFPFAKSLWIHLLYNTRGKYDEYRPPSRSPGD